MSEHPDVAALLKEWDDLALNHTTWTALSRVLDATVAGFGLPLRSAPDTSDYSTRELADMVRAGIAFVMQSLPDVEYADREDAQNAVIATCHLIIAVTVLGARYNLPDAQTIAHREAYGL